jgi:hypothetical protein
VRLDLREETEGKKKDLLGFLKISGEKWVKKFLQHPLLFPFTHGYLVQ